MHTINPSVVIMDMDADKPMRFGPIQDAAVRAKINALRARHAKADPEEKPIIEEQISAAVEAGQDAFTVGRAIIEAVKNPLPDKANNEQAEQLTGAEKLDLDDFAIRIRVAHRAGADAVATFSAKEIDIIKDRVNRAFPSPTVVAQVFRAIKADAAV